MTEQHNKFLKRLDKSRSAVFKVAEYLHKAGFDVLVPATKFAPYAKVHLDYVDEGDIIATKGEEKHKIEVKQIFRDFQGRSSWPYPITIVSNVGTVDRANNSVTAYIVLNNDMTHMVIIWAKTKPKWVIKDLPAKNTGNIERYYCCPNDLVEFRAI